MSRFQEGYVWALDVLRAGTLTQAELEAHVECAEDFGEFDDFDRGVMAAIREQQ